ncbi:unnamed protein product [Didymodactylos carnosus]|uniref:K Homology domain-containing protein n=2 Tax=Didymodactylos carnosus TaxID=1234261 RepID=A0A815FPZ5_9BILA|nr:unnamed protein product [Didymodactylos carnosus]CAF4176971.1 unnamed protein product [Didymodactylos carnosus]
MNSSDYTSSENIQTTTNGTDSTNQNNSLSPLDRRKRASNSSQCEIRILMTSKDAGAIIGKGGNSIQKLRSEHKCTIQIPDCSSPERILIISGDYEQCFDCLKQVVPILTDLFRSSNSRRRNSGSDQQQKTNSNNTNDENSIYNHQQPSEVRLLVHQIYCGAIIGKGGERIKELRAKYNLDIKVFSRCCPLSNERVVSVRGKSDDIIECIKYLFALTESSSQQQQRTPPPIKYYDPHNFDNYITNEYGGFPYNGIPSNGYKMNVGGRPFRGMMPMGPTMYQLPPLLDYGPRNFRPIITSTQTLNVVLNKLSVHRVYSTALTSHYFIEYRVMSFVGAIMGPRGRKIQEIRHQTNANIIVDDQQVGNGDNSNVLNNTGIGATDRIITIEGTPDQIHRAQMLLQQAVRQSGLWRS